MSQVDVFVSYAHADNDVPHGAAMQFGWVTALAANLNIRPGVRKKNIFIDHRLRPGDAFSDDLLRTVQDSSLLVLMLSQNYIDSKWCGDELEHFVRTHQLNPERPSEVFVVELFPYETLVNVPPSIQQLRKHNISARFWFQPVDSSVPVIAGYPSAHESGSQGSVHYWKALNELQTALDTRLRVVKTPTTSGRPVRAPLDDEQSPPEELRPDTVLLADATDDLEVHRTAIRVALAAEGVRVLPEGDYVGLSSQEFEAAIRGDLERADLFVQLLSPIAGRTLKGFAAPLPQLQFLRAREFPRPILQWCEQLPLAAQTLDADHARLFDTEFVRATHREDFMHIVLQWLHEARRRRERAASASVPPQTVEEQPRRLLFVDDMAGAPELSARLRQAIRLKGCSIRSLPAGAALGREGVDVQELLRPCRAGLTVYTDRSMASSARNRLLFFLNNVADGRLPLTRWGVVLEHGTVESEFGIESDEIVSVTEDGLPAFLASL